MVQSSLFPTLRKKEQLRDRECYDRLNPIMSKKQYRLLDTYRPLTERLSKRSNRRGKCAAGLCLLSI